MVFLSGALRGYAVALTKIANDIRWLGSGPRCGIGELKLPAVQPGSSIMPGKVNPVIAESVAMVCAQVIGYDATIAWCGAAGNFELNVMMPVMAYDLLEAIDLLAAASVNFSRKLVAGLAADHERATSFVERSLAMGTRAGSRDRLRARGSPGKRSTCQWSNRARGCERKERAERREVEGIAGSGNSGRLLTVIHRLSEPRAQAIGFRTFSAACESFT